MKKTEFLPFLFIGATIAVGITAYFKTMHSAQNGRNESSRDLQVKELATASINAHDQDRDEKLSALTSEMEQLKARLNQLLLEKHKQPLLQSSMESNAPEDIDIKGVEDDADASDKETEYYEEKLTLTTEKLMSESRDLVWSSETIQSFEEAVQSNEELAGIEIIQTACGSTVCKFDIAFKEGASIQDTMQKLSHHRTWTGPTTFSIDGQGYAQIVFEREGD